MPGTVPWKFRKFLDRIEGAVPQRTRPASDLGQLRHAQNTLDSSLAGSASALHVHFTPTSASGSIWSSAVRGADRKTDSSGVHRSTRELEQAIRRYIESTNHHPSPSYGPKAPMKSSPASAAFVSVFLTQDTSLRRKPNPQRCYRRFLTMATGFK